MSIRAGADSDLKPAHLLNEIEGLKRPTLENICLWAAARLKPKFPGLKQVRVARPSNGETCIHDM